MGIDHDLLHGRKNHFEIPTGDGRDSLERGKMLDIDIQIVVFLFQQIQLVVKPGDLQGVLIDFEMIIDLENQHNQDDHQHLHDSLIGKDHRFNQFFGIV